MPRVAIVKLSTVAKYGRWDARFYLGDPELPKELERSRQNAINAIREYRKKKTEAAAERTRLQAMRDTGEVVSDADV